MTVVYRAKNIYISSSFVIAYSLPKPSYWKDVSQHREYMFFGKALKQVLKSVRYQLIHNYRTWIGMSFDMVLNFSTVRDVNILMF